jgi:hypothetical protein
MLDKMRVSRIGFDVCCGFLIVLATSVAHAQRAARITPPNSLLQILDQDDRDCVLTNGGLSRSVRVQSIALAADGTRQILVKGSGSCLCGAQNCGFWIYRKKNRQYELLLKGAGSTRVRAVRSSINGYHDIVSESHASAIETIIRTYRFDGKEYQRARCISRAYYDENGNMTRVPVTRPCSE